MCKKYTLYGGVMKKTIVINLIGGPCSGKSTVAAELFARLKKMGIKTELVSEYIKDRINLLKRCFL